MTIARDDRKKNARRLRALIRARSRLPALVPVGAMTLQGTLRAALLAGTMLSAQAAFAQLPQGGQVVGGAATIAQPTANQMVITQSTQRAAINWQSFNIGAGNGVQFVQPSSSAIALNRVVGLSGPSQILGSLTANGQVYIVNPQGVVFGKGAMVNTGALLATTRDINPTQFMAGGDITLSGGSAGKGLVKNSGTITAAPGGYVVLAGDRVVNKGTIETPGGHTVLAAGDQATVALSNGQLVNVTMNASVANATVKNSGVIKAEGGKVTLSANGAGTVIGGAINLSGTIDVSAALAGDITIDAGPGGTLEARGATIKAVSTAGKGGTVTLTGDRVGLFDGTKVNASGSTGGGTVKVGGGVQGKDASVRNASVAVLDPTSSIDASATDRGNGGTVVLWSQDYTGFYGTILAKGGPNGGNGGWIETSSHDNLQAWGSIDVRAALGTSGSWLLDPSNVTIAAAANASATFNTSNGTWSASQPNATINVAALNSQLSNGTSVTITTVSANSAAGNININANIAKTGGADANLTMFANGTINDNGVTISSTVNKLNVTMRANSTVTLANGSSFQLNGGFLTVTGGLQSNSSQLGVNIGQTTINAAAATITGTTNSAAFAVNLFGGLNASGANLTITGTNGSNASVNLGDTITARDLTVTGTGKGNGSGIVAGSTLNASGNLTLNGNTSGSLNSSTGVLLTGSACASGNVTINGTANNGIAVNLAATVNSTGGNVTIDGTSQTGRGVRLSGTIAAANTILAIGRADDANGLAVPGTLNLSAAGGATLIGSANTANGTNIAAAVNAAGTNLTINGTAQTDGDAGLVVTGNGSVDAVRLTIVGCGTSGSANVGGVIIQGTLNSTGDMVINGTGNKGIGVNLTGTVNASGGNLTMNGTSVSGRGVRLSGNMSASGTVNVTGSSTDGANGIALPGDLNLNAGGVATFIGTAVAANGINISGNLGATGTRMVLNGTSTQNGSFAGVNITGAVNVAELTINGSANAGSGVDVTGSLNVSNGTLTINGSANAGRGVRLAGTVLASGVINVAGSSSNGGAGIGVTDNLTLSTVAGATMTGTATSANAVNISGNLTATGTNLTLNGNATSSDTDHDGVKISGTVTATNLVLNGSGMSNATGTEVSGTVNATGNVAINGTSIGSRGVRLAGTIGAGGRVDVNGTATGTGAAIGVASSLNLAAVGGATFTGNANAANGINISANLNASGAPNLTLNGTTTSAFGNVYGVNITGDVQAGNLTVNGLGNLTATSNVGGTSMTGTINASGNVTLNGQSNGGYSGVYSTGRIVSGGNIVLNGSGNNRYGANVSGTLNAAGTVTINGTSNGTTGVLFETNLNIAANGGATVEARSNSTNGFFFGGVLNASATPLLTINGTSANTGGNYYGVAFTGNASAANLTINGVGNLSATGNVGGTTFTGTANATGNVTMNGQSNGRYPGIHFTGSISGNNIVLNGTANQGIGVDAIGTLSATGAVTVTGRSNVNTGVLVAGELMIFGSNAALSGTTNTGQYGVDFTSDSILTAGAPLVITGTGGTSYGVALDGSGDFAGVTINGSSSSGGGIEVSGRLYTGDGMTLNANRITLNNASLGGNTSGLVLQALDSTAPMTVNGTGGDLGDFTSVRIGSTGQAATLNLAAPLSYAGDGDLSVLTGAANILLNGNINGSSSFGSVILSAGNGVPLNASQANGNVTGGDVVVGSATSLSAGSHGTVVIYSGNANSAVYAPLVLNGGTRQTKAYATLAGEGNVNASSALNLFYRVVPTAAVTLGNSAGANVSKVYDGNGVAIGYKASGGIDGDTVNVTMTGTLNSSAPLTAGQALHAGSYTISQGNATFTADHNYAVSVANGSIVITPRTLTVTATSDTKVFDGTTSSSKRVTVDGLIAGDTLTGGSYAQVFASPAAGGANSSILLPSSPLTNASFASSTAGSLIGDYAITYTAALGTILPSGGGGGGTPTAILPPGQVDGLASANVLALGSWLNSGGLQQNIPAGLTLNDNVLHLMFTTSSTGQPLVQASWNFFNADYSGTINLPVNVSTPNP